MSTKLNPLGENQSDMINYPAANFEMDDLAKVENEDDEDFIIQIPETTLNSQKKTTNSVYSRKESAKNSTAKYREKKKKQLTDLEECVKDLENELEHTQSQIQTVKQSILTGLESLAKMNQSTNENIEIYNQLEALLGKTDPENPQMQPLFPGLIDFDKINMLLDTLKYRIGASGRERQSKLAYHYKTIVNTIFPALYRYILFSSIRNQDIFDEEHQKGKEWEWTNQLISKLNMHDHQVKAIKEYQVRLQQVFQSTNKGISNLNEIRDKLKQEAEKVEAIEEQMRMSLNPIQCAKWTIFSEKYKYRKEIRLDMGFLPHPHQLTQPKILSKQDDDDGRRGRKRVKLSLED